MKTFAFVLGVCAALTAMPAAAATITVNAGGSLQAAIDAARPGDTIELQPGAVFTGPFQLRAKGGTEYITIRTATPDSQLPAAGMRMTPAYAPLLAKIKSSTAGSAIKSAGGANYWRLLFLEFLPGSSTSSANLVEFGGAGSNQDTLAEVPHHFIMDRCYLHGDPGYGQRRGLALNSGDAQVINSHFSDFKRVNQDTQAIMGWNGPGPYLIENNYLEAAAENIMFGGTDPAIPNLVPANIRILRNHITKQPVWRTQGWTLKNLIEFKNVDNALVEGNVIENNWTAGQQGYSILFTPRNQSGTAPWSVVKNVTIQHNLIRHVSAVFNISGYDDLATSQQTHNITIRNNLIYDVNTSYTATSNPAPGRLAIIGNGPRDITIDHNTVDNNGSSTIFLYAGKAPTGTKIYDFVLTNNLLRDNGYGVFGDKLGEGNIAFSNYTPNADIRRNVFAGASAKSYPTGNDFPTMAQWLADFVNAAIYDYRLVTSSISNNAATDGTDIGIDFDTINAAISGSPPPTPPPPTEPPPPSPPPPPPAPPSGGSTPYTGTPVALPGTVQAENYDGGGSGVAYSDTTSGNTGGVYRSNNVDIAAASDAGGGYTLGWVMAGEWLKYTVNVSAGGTYTLDFRVSSKGGGGTFHLEVNGVDKTGPLSVPNTGSWNTWTTVTKTDVALAAGPQVFRLVLDANAPDGGSVGNFNWIGVR